MTILFISGCGKGIGREMINNWLKSDKKNKVVGIYRSNVEKENELEKYADRLCLVQGDASEKKLLEKCFSSSKKIFKDLPQKYLVNAGVRCRSNIEDIKNDTLENLWNTNYFGLRKLLILLIDESIIKKNISLVYVSSIVANVGFINLDDYGATKAAAESLLRSIAMKYPSSRFNTVAPGFTKTSYANNFMKNLPDLYDWTLSRIPTKRWAESKEICSAINFLLSNNSSYITGQRLVVDGGWLASS